MPFGEPLDNQLARSQRQKSLFPELQVAGASDIFAVERRRRQQGQEPTSVGRAVESSFIQDTSPDAAPRGQFLAPPPPPAAARPPATVWDTGAAQAQPPGISVARGKSGPDVAGGILSAARGAASDISSAGNFFRTFENRPGHAGLIPQRVYEPAAAALGKLPNPVREAGNIFLAPTSVAAGGSALQNLGATVGGQLGAAGAEKGVQKLGAPEGVQQAAGLLGGLAGGIGGFGAGGALEQAGKRAVTRATVGRDLTQQFKAGAPLEQLNQQAVSAAETGQPITIAGFRKATGEQIGGRGTYYGTTEEMTKLGTGGRLGTTSVRELSFQNPLVVDTLEQTRSLGDNVAQALDAVPRTGDPTKQLTAAEQAIAEAAKAQGHDGIVFRSGPLTEVVDLRPSAGERVGAAANKLATDETGSFSFGRKPAVPHETPPAPELPPEQQALQRAISGSKSLQEQNAASLHEFRQQQLAAFQQQLDSGQGGEQGARAALGALRGQAEKATFTPLRGALSQEEIGGLYDSVLGSGVRGFDKPTAITALGKLLDGQVPTPSELKPLETIFPGLGKALTEAKITPGDKVSLASRIVDLLNVPRTVKASFDNSAVLRHGLIESVTHPRLATRSFKEAWRAALDPAFADSIDYRIRSTPSAQLMDGFGRYLSPVEATTNLTKNEEQFASNLAERIPGIGRLVKASNRHFATYLNLMRTGVEEQVLSGWDDAARSPDRLQFFADFLNHSTGRGDLPKWMEQYGPALNSTFFSPRYAASRVQVNGDFVRAIKNLATAAAKRQALDPVSKEIAKSAVAFYGTGAAILGTLAAAGLKVGTDPRSSDFGKIRAGHQTYDYWGGLAQDARLIGQLVSGQSVSAKTGNKYDQTRTQTMLNFLRSKLAPVPGAAVDVAVGKDFIGRKITPLGEIANLLSPLVASDIVDAWRAEGPKGAAIASPASFLGLGVTSQVPSNYERAAEQMFPGKAPSDLLPSERKAVEQANPEAAQQAQQERISQGGKSADYEKLKQEIGTRQQANDQQLSSDGDRAAWKERMQDNQTELRLRAKQIFADVPEGPAKTVLDQYFRQIDAAALPYGGVDWDQINKWRASLTPAQNKLIDDNTGLGGTATQQEYRRDIKKISDSGYFDLKDQILSQLTGHETTYAQEVQTMRVQFLQQAQQMLNQQDPQWQRKAPQAAEQLARIQVDKVLGKLSEAYFTPVSQQFRAQNPDVADLLRKWDIAGTGAKETGAALQRQLAGVQ